MKLIRPWWMLGVLIFAATAGAEETHLLYFTSPDGAQGGGSGTGLLIYDINDGHKLVRRIDVPGFKGACGASAPMRSPSAFM
jgi:hypothetical protein